MPQQTLSQDLLCTADRRRSRRLGSGEGRVGLAGPVFNGAYQQAAPAGPQDTMGNGIGTPPGGDVPTTLSGRPEPTREDAPEQPDKRLGWAVAGLGDFAQTQIIPAFAGADHSALRGLVSGAPDKLSRLGKAYGIPDDHCYDYDGFDAIADDEAIDVVYIITPNALHTDLVIRAFRAGKHVMCEKPLATNSADCERMIEAAEQAGKKLMVAYRAHFEPHNKKAKEMLETGKLGRLNFVTSDHHRHLDSDRPRDHWRMRKALSGGGSLPDMGIYSLNGAIYFLGESPCAIAAQIYSPPGDERFAEVEDFCAVQARFPSGAIANLSSSYTSAAKRIQLFGDRAVATLDPATDYDNNRLVVEDKEGQTQISTIKTSSAQFAAEIDHLSEAIRNDTPVLTPGEMGLRDVRLIEAIYEAAKTGQWVSLHPDGRMKTA